MKKFWVDFSGYVKVEADTPEEAEQKMWALINEQFNLSGDFSDDVWDIEGIEEASDDGFGSVFNCQPTPQELEDFWNDK